MVLYVVFKKRESAIVVVYILLLIFIQIIDKFKWHIVHHAYFEFEIINPTHGSKRQNVGTMFIFSKMCF